MNRDDILRMAREAGEHQWPLEPEFLERFAALVADAAMKREHQWMIEVLGKFSINNETLKFMRETIRARGEK